MTVTERVVLKQDKLFAPPGRYSLFLLSPVQPTEPYSKFYIERLLDDRRPRMISSFQKKLVANVYTTIYENKGYSLKDRAEWNIVPF